VRSKSCLDKAETWEQSETRLVAYINERAEGKDKDTFRFLFIYQSLSTVAVRLMIDKQEKNYYK
jgi:hypothetical protein